MGKRLQPDVPKGTRLQLGIITVAGPQPGVGTPPLRLRGVGVGAGAGVRVGVGVLRVRVRASGCNTPQGTRTLPLLSFPIYSIRISTSNHQVWWEIRLQ